MSLTALIELVLVGRVKQCQFARPPVFNQTIVALVAVLFSLHVRLEPVKVTLRRSLFGEK
jgi:hypothetical protein